MSLSPRWTLLALAMLFLAQPALAQVEIDNAKVKISTIDGVTLHGYFYPKKNAPVVMILHALGSQSQSQGWKNLAKELQPKYAVMMFDFRGHGDSKTVDPQTFWSKPENAKAGKPTGTKDKIDFKSFDKSYYPVLMNDIAAVKAFLDRKNDSGDCNTSSTIVIGAETGATLGAIWLNSEWNRYKDEAPVGFPSQPAKNPEGKDVIATFWLSMNPELGRNKLIMSTYLEKATKLNGMATIFLYGDGDTTGKKYATNLLASLSTPKDKKKFIGSTAIGKSKLTGAALLESNETNGSAEIVAILDKIVEDRIREWTERDFRRAVYLWHFPSQNGLVIAKSPGEMNLGFISYNEFMAGR